MLIKEKINNFAKKPEIEKMDIALSDEEKEQLNGLMAEFIKGINNDSSLGSGKETDAVLRKMVRTDHRSLYYLKDKLFPLDVYNFSRLCRTLAKEEDLDLILNLIKDNKVINCPDRSAFGHFDDLLKIFICNIREKNENDERLDKITSELIQLMGRGARGCERLNEIDISKLIAYTGTNRAENYLRERGMLSENNELERCLSDVKSCYFPRKVSAPIEPIAPSGSHAHTSYSSSVFNVPENGSSRYFDYVWDDDDDTLDDEKEEVIEDGLTEIYQDDGYWDDYDYGRFDDSNHGYVSFEELDDTTKKIIIRVKEDIDSKGDSIDETIRPISKLILFNELIREDGNDRQAKAEKRIEKLQKIEKFYLGIEEMPTVGIEVECDADFLNPDKVRLLDELGISNYAEGSFLQEVNPGFSYSPNAQARMLEELVKLGVIPKETDELGKSSINKSFTYSLHVNFGIPDEIKDALYKNKETLDNSVYELVDVATYAFISPERVLKRKTRSSLNVKNAEESKKNKKEININASDFSPNRLEYRANEFRDYSSFRMISETQRLAAMLFSNLKVKNGKPVNVLEEKLSNLWIQFLTEFKKIRSEYGVEGVNLVDEDEHQIFKILKETDLQKKCRSLISEFSRKVILEIELFYN